MKTRKKSQNKQQYKQLHGLLPVKNDYVFSRLFGAKNHEHILISLLNSILNGRPHIKSIKLEPTEFRKKTPKGKSVRLDIVATTDDGTIIQVEMQCVNKGNIIDRAIFCQSRLRAEELKEGEDYSSVPDVISIWICDQSVTDRVGCCHEMLVTYQKTNLDPFEPASKKVRYYIIELHKLNKIPQGVVGKNFKIWMVFIRDPGKINKKSLEVPEVRVAKEELVMMSADKETRAEYLARVQQQNDIISGQTTSYKEGLREGEAKGLKKGEKIGEARGLKKGEEIGRKQGEEIGKRQNALEIAKNLLAMHLSLKKIAQIVRLPLAELEGLKG